MKSNKTVEQSGGAGPDNFIRVWHLAMIVLCFAALFTGDMADDYKKLEGHSGYIIHGCLGMAVAVVVALYIRYGIVGPRQSRFAQWFPFTRERLRQTRSDLAGLLSFKLPEHKRREGLAGLVQFLGMLIFSCIAVTGLLLYFYIEPGSKVKGLLHAVKEGHEVGGVFIPLYLSLHIGAVIAHSLTGNQVWKDIFLKNGATEKSSKES